MVIVIVLLYMQDDCNIDFLLRRQCTSDCTQVSHTIEVTICSYQQIKCSASIAIVSQTTDYAIIISTMSPWLCHHIL